MLTNRIAELAYAQPDEFIPERWYSRPELVRHKSAFAPFSLGTYNILLPLSSRKPWTVC